MKNRAKLGFGTGISQVLGELAPEFLLGNAIDGLGTIFNPTKTPDFLSGIIKEQNFANGGVVGSRNVEVEGNEVAETPSGQILDFKGPSHEAGGIDTTLPVGTTVFSDRISVDGKTMQERKKKRVSTEKKLSKYLDTNPSDIVSKNTFDRTKVALDSEEMGDLAIQEIADRASNPQKYAFGGVIGDVLGDVTGIDDLFYNLFGPKKDKRTLVAPTNIPTASSGNAPSTTNNFKIPTIATPPLVPTEDEGYEPTAGDTVNRIGNMIGGISPLATTLANRAGDTPNVNSFKDFGVDALAANSNAKDQVTASKVSAQQAVQLQETGARNRNRNSANSVNTLRGLDFITDAMADNANTDINSAFAKEMSSLFGQEAQLQNQQDNYVMGGEAARDDADRKDRDSFFTNLGQGLTGVGTAIANEGKDMNTIQSNQDILDLIADMSKNGITYKRGKNGKLQQVKVK